VGAYKEGINEIFEHFISRLSVPFTTPLGKDVLLAINKFWKVVQGSVENSFWLLKLEICSSWN